MAPFETVVAALLFAELGVMVLASLAMATVTLRYQHKVLFPSGMLVLASALPLLTLGILVQGVFFNDVLPQPWVLVASYALITLAAAAFAAGTWLLARDQFRGPHRETPSSPAAFESGFGDGGDDG